MDNEISFQEWYNKTSEQEGALVTPATASKLLETTPQYLQRLEKQGRIKKHYFDNQPYIGMNDINKEIIKRQSRKKLQKEREEKELQKINKQINETGANKFSIIFKSIFTAVKSGKKIRKTMKEKLNKELQEIIIAKRKLTVNDIINSIKKMQPEYEKQEQQMIKELEAGAYEEIEKAIEKDLKDSKSINI